MTLTVLFASDQILLILTSLLEPFWPDGTGCARGFLSALDAAWMLRSWSLQVIARSIKRVQVRISLLFLVKPTWSVGGERKFVQHPQPDHR